MEMLDVEERRGLYTEMQWQMLQVGPAGVGGLVVTWLNMHGTRVDTNNRFDIYASNVLGYCERHGWIENPALLIRLIEKIAPTAMTNYAASLPRVAARLRNDMPEVADYYREGNAWDTCHLSAALPFLNRDITRRTFEKFFNPLPVAGMGDAARALVVNGPPGSGKTFTGDFLRMLIGIHEKGLHAVAEADFLALTGEPLTPDRLAAHLGKQMEIDPQQLAQQVRGFRANNRPKDIAIWLADEAYRTGKTWHLLLDNFNRSGVPETTLIFIDQLLAGLEDQSSIAWNIRDPHMGVPLRLVLLGHARELPARRRLIRVEEIHPVTADDLRQHFRRYFIYKNWPADDAEINRIVRRYEEQILPVLFPAVEPAPAGGGAAAAWRMRELRDVVLLDCLELERRRTGATPAAGMNAVPHGGVPAGDLANG